MINAVRLYRIANKLYKYNIPIIPKIIKLIIFLVYNSILPYECEIGKNTSLGYGGIAVVVHKDAVIGKGCIISQCVTIGGKQNSKGVPKIGNNVHIGAGAKILGNISIGNNVLIGANAVVLKDIPDNSIVAGVPAKIIKVNDMSRGKYE